MSLPSNEQTIRPQPLHPSGFVWIYIAVICLVLPLSITSRSLWIDEAWTAQIAQQPTLTAWWGELRGEKVSDLQMPLYSLWIWGCEKVFGSSEAALRAVNLFWLVPALLVLLRGLRGKKTLQLAAFLIAAFSPFAWYYLNEARSYVMQLSTSLFLYAVLYHWCRNPPSTAKSERWWILGFVVFLILLCGSSLLSMIFAATPILAALVLLPRSRLTQIVRDHRYIWFATFAILLGLGLYYLWTLRIGARATAIASTDWKNPLFICYELLGFAGLGPGRLAIRGGGLGVFKPYLIFLAFYAAIVAILLFYAMRTLIQQISRWRLVGITVAITAPVAFVLVASAVLHFRVLGRHFAAMAPVAFFLLAAGATASWQKSKPGKIWVILFFALYVISAFSLRFGVRHQKDDYRAAATLAKAALEKGQSVWWNADRMSASYYKLPITTGADERKKAIWIMNPSSERLANAAPVDMIIASRPDVYDWQGTLAQFVEQRHFDQTTNFVAFTVWERSRD